jgi:SRSO17 transposase
MTAEQVAAMGPAFTDYLAGYHRCFSTKPSLRHFQTYSRGLVSDLPRKSIEPIALASGCAVRTLQEFLADHRWDHGRMRDELQRRVAREHLPAPGARARDDLGVIGRIDETSVAKKGNKTPGVQHQYCGASGKQENCLITVHLDVGDGSFRTLLDSELFLPESWHEDRDRCRAAHIPDTLVYRPKWQIGIEQLKRAQGNGIRFDWITFDEGYGGKPPFLYELDALGLSYIGEVPRHFRCWPSFPRYCSPQAPFIAKRVDNAVVWGKPFNNQKWRRFALDRQTLGRQTWEAKAAQVWLQTDGRAHTRVTCRPTDRTYWLIVARNVQTGEIKYFISNAPPKTPVRTLLRVAFSRWGIEHVFRVAKSEIGFDHFEGRSYVGLIRHMVLCQVVMLFLAGQTTGLREKKYRAVRTDHGADRPGIKHRLPRMDGTPLPVLPS